LPLAQKLAKKFVLRFARHNIWPPHLQFASYAIEFNMEFSFRVQSAYTPKKRSGVIFA